MCGRFTHRLTWAQLHELLSLTALAPDRGPSFNVAPTQEAPVVRACEGGRELVFLRWGLVPSWAKDAKIGNTLINARAESAGEKPAFRSAFARRRCVVPVSGFYEWQKTGGGPKQPWYIYRADEKPMLLAGLWERWKPAEGPVMETFTILTTPANGAVSRLHDRMPAVLEPERVGAWLEPGTGPAGAAGLLGPAAEGVLSMHPVGRGVNSPKNNSAELMTPVRAGEHGKAETTDGGLFGSG